MTPDEVLLGADSMSQEELPERIFAGLKRLNKVQQEQTLSFIGWLKDHEK